MEKERKGTKERENGKEKKWKDGEKREENRRGKEDRSKFKKQIDNNWKERETRIWVVIDKPIGKNWRENKK